MTDKFDLMTPNLHGEEVARLRAEIAELRTALTQANELYNSVEAMNLQLTEKIEYAQAGDLVTIPRSIVLAMAAKMKEQTAIMNDARIALSFYREWMSKPDNGFTKYPFGNDVENKIREVLG